MRRAVWAGGSQMLTVTMKQAFSLGCLYNLSLAVTHGAGVEGDGGVQLSSSGQRGN